MAILSVFRIKFCTCDRNIYSVEVYLQETYERHQQGYTTPTKRNMKTHFFPSSHFRQKLSESKKMTLIFIEEYFMRFMDRI